MSVLDRAPAWLLSSGRCLTCRTAMADCLTGWGCCCGRCEHPAGITSSPAPGPFSSIDVSAYAGAAGVVVLDKYDVVDDERWTTYLPLPGSRCTDCGELLERCEDTALSRLCLWCLCGPPFAGAVRRIGNTP